jgi:hypothetical protein
MVNRAAVPPQYPRPPSGPHLASWGENQQVSTALKARVIAGTLLRVGTPIENQSSTHHRVSGSTLHNKMPAVYFAHGYKKEEAQVNEFILMLMSNVGMMPSLDPPSDRVNSAKLERHLRFTDAMVGVVMNRKGAISPYIRFEIEMALRSRKPLVLFLEDTLPGGIFPSHILQARFSRRSFARETLDHLHLLKMLSGFIGSPSAPRYRVMARPRSCLLSGFNRVPEKLEAALSDRLAERGYEVRKYPGKTRFAPIYNEVNAEFAISDLAIVIIDSKSVPSVYSWGAIQCSLTPTIFITLNGTRIADENLPDSYQPLNLSIIAKEKWISAIEEHIDLYEEDFVEIHGPRAANAYASQLLALKREDGVYSKNTRFNIINKLVMGNETNQNIEISGSMQAGGDINLSQMSNQHSTSMNLEDLAIELVQLRQALIQNIEGVESVAETGAVAEAELAAKSGNREGVFNNLKRVGKWTLGIAEKVGVGLAVAAIKSAAKF